MVSVLATVPSALRPCSNVQCSQQLSQHVELTAASPARSHRLGNDILFSHHGGVEVEAHWEASVRKVSGSSSLSNCGAKGHAAKLWECRSPWARLTSPRQRHSLRSWGPFPWVCDHASKPSFRAATLVSCSKAHLCGRITGELHSVAKLSRLVELLSFGCTLGGRFGYQTVLCETCLLQMLLRSAYGQGAKGRPQGQPWR
jgi:hypothetical protein